MDDFVAELARMTLVVGYPNAPEYSTVPPLSGELPHRVRLEEAAYLMMARLRDRHS
uniref:Uncharacterized protein n=1 Tax=Oryza sativa subsp. japonica TaxID=39947 RepID=Q6Z3M6_ORYSJ|nr:hypothetical protein [Oryza sativa Japonica Group]BAD05570.1 hypothetical protein [Oryza sativa Japonica Group]